MQPGASSPARRKFSAMFDAEFTVVVRARMEDLPRTGVFLLSYFAIAST